MSRNNNGEKNKKPSAGDRKLWAEYVRDVRPLDPELVPDPGAITADDDANAPNNAEDDNVFAEPTDTEKQSPSPATGPGPQSLRQIQLDRRTDDKLRRGKLQIEARLDLHGHTREAARHALAQFLREAHANGKRCVLVITGKGAFGIDRDGDRDADQPGSGVLRRSVPEWLATPPLSDIVIRHYPARARHGGNGALYVLLRRSRGA